MKPQQVMQNKKGDLYMYYMFLLCMYNNLIILALKCIRSKNISIFCAFLHFSCEMNKHRAYTFVCTWANITQTKLLAYFYFSLILLLFYISATTIRDNHYKYILQELTGIFDWFSYLHTKGRRDRMFRQT